MIILPNIFAIIDAGTSVEEYRTDTAPNLPPHEIPRAFFETDESALKTAFQQLPFLKSARVIDSTTPSEYREAWYSTEIKAALACLQENVEAINMRRANKALFENQQQQMAVILNDYHLRRGKS